MGRSEAGLRRSLAGFDFWVESVAALSDFDLPKLAAQATSAFEEFDADDRASSLLYMPGEQREIASWSKVADREGMRDGLIRLLRTVRFVACLAAWTLLQAPADLDIVGNVRAKLPYPGSWRRGVAVLVVLDALPRQDVLVQARTWSEDPDPFTRSAVAHYAAVLVGTDGEDEELFYPRPSGRRRRGSG